MNRVYRSVFLIFFILVITLLTIRIYNVGLTSFIIASINSIIFLYLIIKLLLSTKYRPIKEPCNNMSVSVVIPFYNEDTQTIIDGFASIVNQDYPIREIFYIDDGSQSADAFQALRLFSEKLKNMTEKTMKQNLPIIHYHRFEKNKGKRNAQIWAFKQIKSDIIVTVDSDTILMNSSIKELMKPFNNPSIMGTTGHIGAKNRNKNVLTRLINSRYNNAFEVERAYQSYFGNILCCSGPMSAYRRKVIMENINHYSEQTFLGRVVQFGDDRCLTTYANKLGKTFYQSTAVARTNVPYNVFHFLKQQVRWNKSYFRESLFTLLKIRKLHVIVITIVELIMNLVFPPLLMFLIVVYMPSLETLLLLMVHYLALVIMNAYIRNMIYQKKTPMSYFATSLYGMIHLVCLFAIRIYSLFTINFTYLGTR